jgi:hypothetical protein
MFCDEEDVPLSNNGACTLTTPWLRIGSNPVANEGRRKVTEGNLDFSLFVSPAEVAAKWQPRRVVPGDDSRLFT